MSDLILKTKEDINHFLTGCAFLGTGGGGEVSVGRDTLYKCLEKGTEIRLTDPEMIEDEETYCCAFFMGSIAPKTDEILKEMDRLRWRSCRTCNPGDDKRFVFNLRKKLFTNSILRLMGESKCNNQCNGLSGSRENRKVSE